MADMKRDFQACLNEKAGLLATVFVRLVLRGKDPPGGPEPPSATVLSHVGTGSPLGFLPSHVRVGHLISSVPGLL